MIRPVKDMPLVRMSPGEREKAWDEVLIKEEGTILESDKETRRGKVRSLKDNGEYLIDDRSVGVSYRLRPEGKVLFSPVEDSESGNYARIIRILDQRTRLRVSVRAV